ncbi:GntR family transcriptional regulator [Rhizobium sp. SSA_523]|uniref:GntR family transcriptional regulator n=1 Tax=Rhizobium sp. SSA_523 TaxID=2952477 RepID=UPI0020917DE5|nr:GntR family transcriptional regulator [Rhizobium sp. SSA_523]MCO5731383.1 GntR family transcriptional regulator [Rhizobium sp. SSA_523]WKC22091.1 GntR family transcriptional regulator [Rhizobium sp. SSA_523]
MSAQDPSSGTGHTELRSVKQMAYDRFREALFDGRLRPGQFVSQRELVALLGLSIGALRELLPRLQYEGLLVVMPQRGIQITQIDLSMIRQAFQVRMALEREAVLTAVRRMPDAVLDEQKQLHQSILDEVKSAPSPDVFERGQRVDDGFHSLLIEATQNDLLIQAYAVNAIRMRLIKLDRITLSERVLPSAFEDHLLIIDAIKSRDPIAASQAIERHIMNARERAIEL